MRITVLDAQTLGNDVSMDEWNRLGEVTVYQSTAPEEISAHMEGAEVVVLNKVRLGKRELECAPSLRLICITATGFDNVDIAYCREHRIAVCNVVGYSSDCVAQVTVAMALSLITHLPEYHAYVASGAYSASGCFNRLVPVFHEIAGKTYGILGYGNIGSRVARIARALGCRVLVCKRTPCSEETVVDFDTLCRESDILSLHVPLNRETAGILDARHIAMMKPGSIVINVARGAVADEGALADAIRSGHLGGLGVDVYTTEPFAKDHPYSGIMGRPNVLLTPHMAWGGQETRMRLLSEIAENIAAFLRGERRCRVD